MNVPVPHAHAHAHAHALASAILDTERASAKLDMNVLVPPAHAHERASANLPRPGVSIYFEGTGVKPLTGPI